VSNPPQRDNPVAKICSGPQSPRSSC